MTKHTWRDDEEQQYEEQDEEEKPIVAKIMIEQKYQEPKQCEIRESPGVYVGSDREECDIIITSSTIQPIHATFYVVSDTVYIEANGNDCDVYVDGSKIRKKALHHGACITFMREGREFELLYVEGNKNYQKQFKSRFAKSTGNSHKSKSSHSNSSGSGAVADRPGVRFMSPPDPIMSFTSDEGSSVYGDDSDTKRKTRSTTAGAAAAVAAAAAASNGKSGRSIAAAQCPRKPATLASMIIKQPQSGVKEEAVKKTLLDAIKSEGAASGSKKRKKRSHEQALKTEAPAAPLVSAAAAAAAAANAVIDDSDSQESVKSIPAPTKKEKKEQPPRKKRRTTESAPPPESPAAFKSSAKFSIKPCESRSIHAAASAAAAAPAMNPPSPDFAVHDNVVFEPEGRPIQDRNEEIRDESNTQISRHHIDSMGSQFTMEAAQRSQDARDIVLPSPPLPSDSEGEYMADDDNLAAPQQHLAGMKKTIFALEREVEKLQSQLKEAQEQAAAGRDAAARVHDLEQQLAAAQHTFEDFSTDANLTMGDVRKQLEQKEGELQTEQALRKAVQADLQAANKRNVEARQQLEKVREDHNKREQELREQLKSRDERIAKLESELRLSQRQSEELGTKHKQELAKANSTQLDLEQRLEIRTQQMRRIHEQQGKLKALAMQKAALDDGLDSVLKELESATAVPDDMSTLQSQISVTVSPAQELTLHQPEMPLPDNMSIDEELFTDHPPAAQAAPVPAPAPPAAMPVVAPAPAPAPVVSAPVIPPMPPTKALSPAQVQARMAPSFTVAPLAASAARPSNYAFYSFQHAKIGQGQQGAPKPPPLQQQQQIYCPMPLMPFMHPMNGMPPMPPPQMPPMPPVSHPQGRSTDPRHAPQQQHQAQFGK